MRRVLLALMGAAQQAWHEAGSEGNPDDPADPYMTALAYFNSLRELGGARRIPRRRCARRSRATGRGAGWGETRRLFRDRTDFSEPVELTSRVSTDQVAEARRRLECRFNDRRSRVDCALATNTTSLGLDIPRPGLMLVSPKIVQVQDFEFRGPAPPPIDNRRGIATFADSRKAGAMERVDYESLIIQDLLGYYDRDELDVTPWYQRRSVWTQPQKSYLINTIHENKPVPSIYVRHAIDLTTERSIKEVVDGQQRVRCVVDYRDDKFPAKHPNHRAGVYFSKLSRVDRMRFLQSALSVGYLVGATDQDVIEIFARINTVSKTLNPQEKRNANFSGAFKQFCLAESVARLPFWRENGIFTDSQIARMLEVQFVSDLAMNLAEGLQDFSAKKLDQYYKKHDDEFLRSSEIEKRLEHVYSILLALPDGLIKHTVVASHQVLFSLMLVLDSLPRIDVRRLKQCVADLDARVAAMASNESPRAMTAEAYEAFTSGNLHRIRYRLVRQAQFEVYLR